MSWDLWLIFLVLGVIVPWRGRVRLRELLAKQEVTSSDRLALYISTIAFQWIAVAFVAWRAKLHGFTPADLGLTIPSVAKIIVAAIAGAIALVMLQWLNLRRVARLGTRAGHLRALAERILPQSRKELALFLALAVTAGICEEFLYRGFAMTVFAHVGLPTWGVVLLSSILFGLAHMYQGRGGFVSTTLLGLLFAFARIAYDSLVPVMLWHAGVDIVAGIAGPKYLVHPQSAAPGPNLN
jgi:uncharacterized protein